MNKQFNKMWRKKHCLYTRILNTFLDRFSRPSYGGARTRPTTTTTVAPVTEEASKKEVKPAAASRGRSCYIFTKLLIK